MKKLLLFFITLIPTFVFSQVYHQWKWARTFGGTGVDSAVDIKIKGAFLYVTGSFTSPTINWDNTILSNAGGKDIFIAKLDTNGNTIWVRSFGSSGDDRPVQLEVNDNGAVAIWCTSTGSSIVVGGNTITTPSNFYIKLDNNGLVQNSNRPPVNCIYNDFDITDDGSVFFSGYYLTQFTFAGIPSDISKSTRGVFIFKYNSNGAETLARYAVFYDPTGLPPLTGATASMRIETSSNDNTLAFLMRYTNNMRVDLSHLGYTGSFIPSTGKDIITGKLEDTLVQFLVHTYPTGGSFNVDVYDFETGKNGLTYSTYYLPQLVSTYYYLRSDYINSIKNTRSWYYVNNVTLMGDYVNISMGSLKSSESGNNSIFNSGTANNLEIVDSNLVSKRVFNIPAFGTQMWRKKCFQDTTSIYFGETFTNPYLNLNDGIPNATVIHLVNNGGKNILIGKYSLGDKSPLSLQATLDSFRICTDSITTRLAMGYSGTGPLTYRWQPYSIVSDSTILNPKFFINSGSVIAKLTVTDALGSRLEKNFTFFKGVQSNLRLVASDTIVCRGDSVTVSLAGTNFAPANYTSQPYQPGMTSLMVFYSITDKFKYKMAGDHTLRLYNYDDPALSPSHFCIATVPIDISTSKSFVTRYDTICQGGSYLFPNGQQAVFVRNPIVNVSVINSLVVCDSVITTYLNFRPLPVITQNRQVCRGKNFTFPDGATFNNIQSDLTHMSYLRASGCDTMVINTLLQVVESSNITRDTIICRGASYTFPNGVILSNIQTPVTQTSNLLTIYGCDSIIKTNIALYPVAQSSANVFVCPGSSYTFPDQTITNNITVPVIHVSHLLSSHGCDSNITTTVNLYPIYNILQSTAVCSGGNYAFPDQVVINNITAPVTHISHLSTIRGCDSSITTTVNVNPVYDQVQNASVCSGSSYTFPDQAVINNITAPVNHTSHLLTVRGCDSSIVTNISVNPVCQISINVSACSGTSYTFPNDTTINNITSPFTHISRFRTIHNCDSIITYSLSIKTVDTSITKTGRTLTANLLNASYQWLDCTNNYSIITDSIYRTIKASFVGEYAVQVSSQGCVDTSSCYFVSATDIALGGKMEVSAYPVPAKLYFKLKIKIASPATINIELFDLFGKRYNDQHLKLRAGENVINQNVERLIPSTYFLKVINLQTGETLIQKIIKY